MLKKIVIYITIAILALAALNVKVSTKQGINYDVRVYKIPLYIKLIEFVDRDYRYRELARDIVKGIRGDKEKVMAILKWAHANIKTDIPADWSVYDDHIWHTIIRGYGQSDQIADVFTTLSTYAGMPSGWARIFVPSRRGGLVLSFVNLSGRWCVFDVARNVYFINKKGDIASIEDIETDNYEKDAARQNIEGSQLTYEDYFKYMKEYMNDITERPLKQMPFRRIFYEARSLFNSGGEK